MTAHFLRVPEDELGYETTEVDGVIELARSQFANPASHVLDASSLRTKQFTTVKGGYRIDSVDAALDRLDDAFAEQEANRLLVRKGHQGAGEHLAELKSTLLGRTSRGRSKAFNRQPWWQKGYSVRQVDQLLQRVSQTLEGEPSVGVPQLRQVTFSPKWAGYTEAQVDAFLDRAIQYLQISKHLG
ncbi:MAG: DivIVA domain-containing protein [Actinomycetales bacterium]|nr:DivIVA domain-containing protein [Actinomycetales bacterium]